MASTSRDRQPMPLTDQHGATAHAWFLPGTPIDPTHVLPEPMYAELCRLAGVEPHSPWVAFQDRLAAAVAAGLLARHRPSGNCN
jgi:hypothetical protein